MYSFSNKINLFSLSVCVLLFIFLPYKNNIWYDESVSILCSNGITYDTYTQFNGVKTINSADIAALNNDRNVFLATVMDNSNSFLYNISLHYFTKIFGNSLTADIAFSRLWGIAALIALFFLSALLFGSNSYVSIAMVLLYTDLTFWGMSNEIRAYSMGVFFVTLSAIYFFKYTLQTNSPKNLLLFGLSSVAALLAHFFCAYIIGVLVLALLFKYKLSILSKKNLIPVFIPSAVLILYFCFAWRGLLAQNIHTIVVDNKDVATFTIREAAFRFMKFSSINFNIIYPRFRDSYVISILSFLIIIAISFGGVKLLDSNTADKKKFLLLFLLGGSSSLFLGIVSIKNHTLSPFYYRYFVFSAPFCALFITQFLKIVSDAYKGRILMNLTLLAILAGPPVFLYAISVNKLSTPVEYNHISIAKEIISDNVTRIEVPLWDDAFLIQSFLPANYKVTYILNADHPNFTIYKATTTEVIPVIRQDF